MSSSAGILQHPDWIRFQKRRTALSSTATRGLIRHSRERSATCTTLEAPTEFACTRLSCGGTLIITPITCMSTLFANFRVNGCGSDAGIPQGGRRVGCRGDWILPRFKLHFALRLFNEVFKIHKEPYQNVRHVEASRCMPSLQ